MLKALFLKNNFSIAYLSGLLYIFYREPINNIEGIIKSMSEDSKKDFSQLFYEGEIRDLNEAGAIFLKRLIEEDLPANSEFPDGMDPYKWLADVLGKHERSVKAWTYDWGEESGTKPTIIDFLRIIKITRSQRTMEFIKCLIYEGSPEEHADDHNELVMNIAEVMRDLADRIEQISTKKDK